MSRSASGPRYHAPKTDVIAIPFERTRISKSEARAKLLVVFAPTLVDGFLGQFSDHYRFHKAALSDGFLAYISAKQSLARHSVGGIDRNMDAFKVMGAPT